MTSAVSVDAVYAQAFGAVQMGQRQEAVRVVAEAMSHAVHRGSYSTLQQLAQVAKALLPGDPWLGCARLYAQAVADNAQAAALRDASAAWVDLARPEVVAMPPRGQHERPRLAYLVSQPHHDALLAAVLAAHDPGAVEVHLLAREAWPGMPRHVQQHDLGDPQWVAHCKALDLDLIVDTAGLQPFAGQFEVVQALLGRLGRLQAGWMGCLASSGGVFDCLLADEVSVAPGEESDFSEKVVRLEGGQWCWQPPASAPPVASAPFRTQGHLTLGVVGRGLRQGPQFLATLVAVMAAVPTLRLRVIGHAGDDRAQREAIVQTLALQGIGSERVGFDPWASREGYWRWLGEVDLVLDTCPASGGLSLLDTLWMGVPVMTYPGKVLGSRQAASVLTALGLGQWVAKNPDDLVLLVRKTASDLVRLQASRLVMREMFALSPLLNGERVARQIEALARQAHNA